MVDERPCCSHWIVKKAFFLNPEVILNRIYSKNVSQGNRIKRKIGLQSWSFICYGGPFSSLTLKSVSAVYSNVKNTCFVQVPFHDIKLLTGFKDNSSFCFCCPKPQAECNRICSTTLLLYTFSFSNLSYNSSISIYLWTS